MISSVAQGERRSDEPVQEEVVWGPSDGLWSVLIPLISSLSFIGLSTLGAIGG